MKRHKYISIYLTLFFASLIFGSLSSAPVLAASSEDNNPESARKYNLIIALEKCMSGITSRQNAGADKFFGIYNDVSDTYSSDETLQPVGYYIDSVDGARGCDNMNGAMFGAIGMSIEGFRKEYYKREDQTTNSNIVFRDADTKDKILKKIKEEKDKIKLSELTKYEYARRHFEVCYKTTTKDNGLNPIKIANLTTGKVDSVYLELANDMEDDDSVTTGRFASGYDGDGDGSMRCSTLKKYMDDKANDAASIAKKLIDANTPPTIGSGNTSGGSSSGSTTDDSCESTGGSLSWIACPVLDLLDGAAATLDSYVQQFLEIDIKDDGRVKLREAWKVMRTFAYILLVPIMLIMVIGTATGSQFIDAYTVKKAFPRMVAAVIFIALSWFLCMELINLTNVVGTGIRGIILNPFDVPNPTLSGILAEAGAVGGTSGGTAVVGGLALGAGAFVAGAASLGIIASTLFSAAIVMGIAFILLIARQVVIMGLVIAAPLAILSWIFPGNDKLWKFWWGAFSKLLFLFPVIMAMIAMGTAFASIVKDVVQ